MRETGFCYATIQFSQFVFVVKSTSRCPSVSNCILSVVDQNIFAHQCKVSKAKLLQLGSKIVDNLEDEKIERVFLDSDFKDRTILKIVTHNNF